MQTLNSQVVRRNYIRTTNPFNLQEPPASFLDGLEALDAELVIFPSVSEPCYRLCRRTRGQDIWKVLKHYPDTELLVAYNLAPWKSVLPTSLDMAWERVLLEIPEYDQWKFKNADAVADHLDALEDEQDAQVDREIRDGAHQVAGHGYRVMTRQTGASVHMNERRGASPRPTGMYGALSAKRGSAVFLGR